MHCLWSLKRPQKGISQGFHHHLWGMTSLLPVDHLSTSVSRPTTTHLVRSQIQVIVRLGEWAIFPRWSQRGTMQIWDLLLETEASLLPLLSAHLPSPNIPRQRSVPLRPSAAILVLKTFTATARSLPAPTKCRGSDKNWLCQSNKLLSTPPCQRAHGKQAVQIHGNHWTRFRKR